MRKSAVALVLLSPLAVLLAILGVVFIGLASMQDEATLNFRLSAAFEVDGAIYEGDAIWGLRYWIVKFPATAGPYSKVRGEAMALTGGPKNLFLLRKRVGGTSGDGYGAFPQYCVPSHLPSGTNSVDWLTGEFRGPCNLTEEPRVPFPTLVEITDLGDPTSIREVTYTAVTSDEPCPSPCLRALTVERSGIAVTTGIDRILPWLASYQFGMTDVATGALPKTGGPSMGRPMLIDFSTEVGNGRMYAP